ncbi:MAG: restriction endonuclease subunit S [Muribaculaceae bacterium]|nr:restriction endonuclease subunit S [Muribaculaceae bacterium]
MSLKNKLTALLATRAELDANLSNKLRKSILQEAIQGKLVEQNPDDEPASLLLERIKQEKERLIKEKKIKRDKQESIIFRGDDNKYYENLNGVVTDITDQIPFDIPNSWQWVRLGHIGDWGAGATPARGTLAYYQNGTIPWLKTGELNNGIVYDSVEHITDKALQKCSLRLANIGDVLIAMYGATIGKLAIAGAKLTTNQACCGCTPYNGIFNKYLFYFLMANKDTFLEMGAGGAQPNISREKIVRFLFALPPENEQCRIVSMIDDLFQTLD